MPFNQEAYRKRISYWRNAAGFPIHDAINQANLEKEQGMFGTDDEPIDLDIPPGYDVGNVRAICYAINSGNSIESIARFLKELGATFTELEGVIKLYKDHYDIQITRFESIKKLFKEYAELSNLPARRDPCYNCKKNFIYWNLITVKAKPKDKEKSISINICKTCHTKLSKNLASCKRHRKDILLGNVKPECPLYPRKCNPKGYCTSSECLHEHLTNTHKGYNERRWKANKRFLSGKAGTIIKSDIMTGVEFEVIGKNKQTLRTNIFKLGKHVGIDHDTSLHPDHTTTPYYMATEVVTPPASGRKLEDLVSKVSTALVKDGFIANEKCGLHVHIDLFKKYGHININPDFYKSLLAAYVLYENVFYNLVPANRSRNPNVKTIEDKFIDYLIQSANMTRKFSRIWYRCDDDKKIQSYRNQKKHDSKYYWVNFHSLLRKEGLEIRIMEGTLDTHAILMWTRLHHEFIQKVSEIKGFYKSFADQFTRTKNTPFANQKQSFIDFLRADKELIAFINEREKMHKASLSGGATLTDEDIINTIGRGRNVGVIDEFEEDDYYEENAIARRDPPDPTPLPDTRPIRFTTMAQAARDYGRANAGNIEITRIFDPAREITPGDVTIR